MRIDNWGILNPALNYDSYRKLNPRFQFAELTPAEKASAIKRRKILWASLQGQGGNSGTQGSTIKGPGMPQGFASSTADSIGMSKRSINEYVRIADALGDALDDIQGTHGRHCVVLRMLLSLARMKSPAIGTLQQLPDVGRLSIRIDNLPTSSTFDYYCQPFQ